MPFHWLTGIEDTFVPHAEPGKRKLDEYELLDHYTCWREDLGLMRELGVDMARYGIPWYKVEPAPGVFDWDWVDRVMAGFAEAGIAPVIDLVHYGTPLWMENTFLNNRYAERVAAFAGAFARRYKDTVHWYTPLNEPYVNALFCGQKRLWPPYLEGEHGYVTVWRPVVKGMVLAEQAIRAENPQARFMQVDASTLWLAADPTDEALVERVEFLDNKLFLTYDALLGRIDDRHPLVNYLQAHGMTDAELDWHRTHRGSFDYMGVNFYPHLSVHELFREPPRRGPIGTAPISHNLEYGDRALWSRADRYKEVMRRYWERYHLPIIHTESSSLGPPDVLMDWLEDSLAAVRELRAEGVALEGYTWWPLYDLIDWQYRYGGGPREDYVCRMGLWQLEMGFDGIFDRVPTPLVERFKHHVKTFNPGPVAAGVGG